MMTQTVQRAPDDRAMGFERVEGGGDTTSAAALLVVAYLVMWVILIGFIWLSWKKLGRVQGRLETLERSLSAGAPTDK